MRGRSVASVLVVLLPSVLAACSASPPTPPPEPGPHATIVLADGWAMAVRTDAERRIDLVADSGEPVATRFHFDLVPRPTVHFSSFSQPERNIAWLYLFGIPPTGATKIQTAPAAAEATIADGLFVAAIPDEANLQPGDVRWTFQSASGATLLSGTGGR